MIITTLTIQICFVQCYVFYSNKNESNIITFNDKIGPCLAIVTVDRSDRFQSDRIILKLRSCSRYLMNQWTIMCVLFWTVVRITCQNVLTFYWDSLYHGLGHLCKVVRLWNDNCPKFRWSSFILNDIIRQCVPQPTCRLLVLKFTRVNLYDDNNNTKI